MKFQIKLKGQKMRFNNHRDSLLKIYVKFTKRPLGLFR